MTTQRYLGIALATVMAASVSSQALAQAAGQSVTGTIDVTLELTAACRINGIEETSGLDFGLLDFGTQTTLFEDTSSEVQSDGSAISVICSPETTPSVAISGGSYDEESDAGNVHALSNGTSFVPYSLYTDADHTQQITLGQDLPLAGTPDGVNPQTLSLYGRAVGRDGLTPGTYNDTLNVVLSF
ncbi:spore coat U domain-containing protein [Salinicola halophilus]|uniref:Csu type fimbrial protein n=1 Tax=Salinicola halophilus TaxID=184065 RepID=UPI0013A6301F|nr:spore coat U domain-containing protein [Salinicola halophilus]